jgi:hypothetical protein
MKARLLPAVLAAVAAVLLAPPAQAGCVIAPDGKSINVVTDNGSSDEKSCEVNCQVDTKIGVIQVACGGNTPPLAKAHSLCGFDKPEAWYKKVVSSKDSCEGGTASAAPAAPAPVAAAAPAVKAGTFICRISADGHSFDAIIANPYNVEASCQVNCQVSTTKAGTTIQSSCTKNIAPGVGEVVLCSKTLDDGKLVKVVGGSGECTDPTPKQPSAAEKNDEDAKVQRLMNQPMPKHSAANKADEEELKNIGDDPAKMQEFMNRKMNAEMQKALEQMNK